MPMLSVIISSFNRLQLLKRAIRSVRRQTFKNIEIIVCDDGSPDPRIEKYLKELTDNGIIDMVIRGEKNTIDHKMKVCTFAELVNRALAIAKGKYISYLCDVDEYLPRRCERFVNYLEENKDIDVVFGIRPEVRNGSVTFVDEDLVINNSWKDIAEILMTRNFINHNQFMHRKADENVRWDESKDGWHCTDYYFFKALINAGLRFKQVPWIGELNYTYNEGMGIMQFEKLKNIKAVFEARYQEKDYPEDINWSWWRDKLDKKQQGYLKRFGWKKMSEPLLTVIVSSFNRPDGLKRTLDSVFNQSIIEKTEVIICDDGSTNQKVKDMLVDYEKADLVSVIRNDGISVERKKEFCTFTDLINRAMDISTSEYTSYICDGDEYTPERCETYAKRLDQNPKISLVWGLIRNVDQGNYSKLPVYGPMSMKRIKADIKVRNFINHNSVMHRRTIVRWDTCPNSWKCADWLFWKRLLTSGAVFENLNYNGELFFIDPNSLGECLIRKKEAFEVMYSKRT